MSSFVLSGVTYLHDHDIVPLGSQVCCPSLLSFSSRSSARSDAWLVNRPENILFRTKDPLSDMVTTDFGVCVPRLSRRKHVSYACDFTLRFQAPRFLCGTALLHRRKFRLCHPRSTQSRGARQACQPLLNSLGTVISYPYQSSIARWNADNVLQIIT